MINILLFVGEVFILFFLSRQTIKELFYFLRIFTKNDHFVFSFVSTIFLPGTIIHEMAHFLTAIILMLKVKEVRIFPKFQDHSIKLGMVTYEKKDFFRGVVVGISPILAALFFFFFLAYFKLFPNSNLLFNIILLYLIFVVSSTMFSSKQDLVDIIFILPVSLIIIGLVYIFNLNLNFIFSNQKFLENLYNFSQIINFYLLFSIIINTGLILLFKISHKLTK